MKKALIFALLLIVLNILGNVIINNMFSDYHKVGGIINYFIVFVIASVYYIGNLSSRKTVGLLLFPLIFLLCSLIVIIFDLFVEGLESPVEILFLITSLISSFFEFTNYLIGDIQNDAFRKIVFAMFNSIGVSIILLALAYLASYLTSKIKFDQKKTS